MLQHLFFAIYILTFSSFLGAYLYTAILIKRFNYHDLSYFLPLCGVGTLFSVVMGISFYGGFITPLPSLLNIVMNHGISFTLAGVIFSVPYFTFNIFKVAHREHYLKVYAAISICCAVILFFSFFSIEAYASPPPVESVFGRYFTIICLVLMLIHNAYLSKKNQDKLVHPLLKSLLREVQTLSLFFIPGFAF